MAEAQVSWLQAAAGSAAQVSWLQAEPSGTRGQVSWLQVDPGARNYVLEALPGTFSWQGAQATPDYEFDHEPGTFNLTGQQAEFTFVNYAPAVPGALSPGRRRLLLTYSPKRRPN